jgi:hypothetical protein
MKKELAKLILEKIKIDLSESFLDFYSVYRHDLDLDKKEYLDHFKNLGEVLFQIDSAESLEDLERLHAKGELDLMGDHFSDYVCQTLLSMEKEK